MSRDGGGEVAHPRRRQQRSALGLAFIIATAAGCASPKRDECRTVTTMMNATADRVDKAQSSPLDPSGLKALAEVLDKSAVQAEALRLTVPEVQKQAKAYAELTREVARTAREMATAGETGDRTKAEAANRTMEQAVAKEPQLVADVNKVCLGE